MKKIPKKIIIFDLEIWSDEDVAQRNWSGENEEPDIIQGAAILLNTKTFKEKAVFKHFVKLTTHKKLSKYISELTNITQEQIDQDGILFEQFLKEFKEFCGNAPIYYFDSRVDSSRRFDLDMLIKNCRNNKIKFPLNENQFHNINKEIFHALGYDIKQSGASPEVFGISIPARPHDALNDVRGLIIGLKELRELKKI